MTTTTHSNELPARSFVPLVDVDPPLVESVMEMLTDENIAAYAQPYSGEIGPYRDVRSPDRPTSRVYVDRARLHVARAIIASRLPSLQAGLLADAAARADAEHMARLSAEQVETAWEELVTSLTDDGDSGTENNPRPTTDTRGSGLSQRLIRQHDPPEDNAEVPEAKPFVPNVVFGPRDYEPREETPERFTPAEPPPLPRPRNAVDRFAWGATIGGPIVVVINHVVGLSPTVGGVGMAAFAAGFITLVARMRHERDGNDDGAVV